MTDETQAAGENQQQKLNIERIYTKDLSFESPNTPAVFTTGRWDPDVDVNLSSRSRPLGNNMFEVVLSVTITSKLEEDKTAYLAEVEQAGIFTLSGFDDEHMQYMQGSYCPNILFPYAREVLSDMIVRGGFPQMFLNPVNFDALFTKQMNEAQNQADEETKQ